jgi:predicted transcriptional regulator
MSQYLDAYFSDGPSPKFSPYHVWKTFRAIQTKGPISRKRLSEILGVGEGSVRTILTKMANEGLIDNSHAGAVLNERGTRRLETMGIEVSPFQMESFPGCKFGCATLTRGTADQIQSGREQRDDAVRAGAEGAVTLVKRGGEIIFPGDGFRLEKKDVESLTGIFKIDDCDTVIIGFAPTYREAEKGAVSAALTLRHQSSRCWSDGPCIITKDTGAGELECIALAMHELVGRMPLGIRSRNKPGVRCEDGVVIDRNYTGPNLEEALATGKSIRRISTFGPYAGAPVVVVPIIRNGEPIAVIGLVDFTKLSIYDIMGRIRKGNSEDQQSQEKKDKENSPF